MLRRLYILFSLALLAGFALGCSKDSETVLPDTTLAIKPTSTMLEAAEGSIFVSVTAKRDWSLTLVYPTDGPSGWATVDPTSGSGNKGDVRLRYQVNEGEAPRSLVLTLTSGTGSSSVKEVKITQKGKEQVIVTPPNPDNGNGYGNGYGLDVVPAGLDWLELPAATANDGKELLIHNMVGGPYRGVAIDGTRNYTCYWDYSEHLSLWVAYPLNPQLYGKGSNDYVWGFDPLLPINIQPDITTRSYGGRGFDGKNNWNRGHQLPRADRQTSSQAVASTCYPTNMTPQDGTFNSGIWAGLESKVRNYISRAYTADTLFVVTGCLYEQSTTFTASYSGFSVKVPTHYFKALLYAGHESQEGVEKDGTFYKAAGFFLPHDPNLGKNAQLDYLMSIDDLETKTGIDFFPNLIKRLGQADADAVEAAKPGNWWK